mmetsp:Transcript_38086/g.93376  ORF Transcript_38086/g.93376 Transcript_38086/m.93376 type:complete len:380 (+) Transcript_38086:68-1207(+)
MFGSIRTVPVLAAVVVAVAATVSAEPDPHCALSLGCQWVGQEVQYVPCVPYAGEVKFVGNHDRDNDYASLTAPDEGSCSSIDLCFAIDESGSLGADHFGKEITFARALVSRLVARVDKKSPSRFSAWLFDQDSSPADDQVVSLTSDFQDVLNSLNGVTYDGGCTNIIAGLKNCATELDDTSRTRVVLLISDGGQTVDANGDNIFKPAEEDMAVLQYADHLKAQGITVMVAGFRPRGVVSDLGYRNFMKLLASSTPTGRDLYYEFSFEAVSDAERDIAGLLSKEMCDDDILTPPSNKECDCSYIVNENPGVCTSLLQEGEGESSCQLRECQDNGSWQCDFANPTHKCATVEFPDWRCSSAAAGDKCDCHLEVAVRHVPVE